MVIGGPILQDYEGAEQWAMLHKQLGYNAAYVPDIDFSEPGNVERFVEVAEQENLVIAEIGAWCNPISPDPETRKKAIAYCKERLRIGDQFRARCCVNIAGSKSADRFDKATAENYAKATFEEIVEVVQEIIDEVKPVHTPYTLEMLPHIFPDSVRSYLDLIEAIDREMFAVHLDVVNILNSPKRYFMHREIITEALSELGSRIRSIHVKDIRLEDGFPVNLQECAPGKGTLDYEHYVSELRRCGVEAPLMLEHLSKNEEYQEAFEYIRRWTAST